MFLLVKVILGVVISYLIGSIPTAYLFGRFYKGIDIRQHGSGNVGATNAFRVLGKIPGALVLLLDAAKGVVSTTVVADILELNSIIFLVGLGLVSVAGHNWTIFLKFKGGKGMATSLGVLIGLGVQIEPVRIVLVLSFLVWGVVFIAGGFVSLASIAAGIFLPVGMVILNQPLELIVMSIVLCLFVVMRHRPNIRRLLAGEEHRFFSLFKKRK